MAQTKARKLSTGGQRCTLERQRGFTVVELMVASTVMAVTLLGVYSVFQQAMRVEGRMAVRWNEASAASVVADHLADTLERCVNIAGLSTVKAGPDEATGMQILTCTVATASSSPWGVATAGIERRRYHWGNEDSERKGTLELQAMPYAGSANIASFSQVIDSEADDEQLWNRVQSQVIGKNISDISVHFRPVNDSDASWKAQWESDAGRVLIRIRVQVGRELAERFVVPQANAPLVAEES